MAKKDNLRRKKAHRFNRKMQIKLIVLFAFVMLGLVILLVRITLITTTDGKKYARQVLSQQSYDSTTIPYRRGQILDRNGIILAKSDLVYNLVLDCMAVNQDEKYEEPTVRALHEVFGLDETEVRHIIEDDETSKSQYQVLKKKVSVDQYKEWQEYLEKKDNKAYGVWFEEQYDRDYPYSTLASKVVGFSNDVDTGVVGLENYYNSLLNGTNGRSYGYMNNDGEYVRTTIDPEHGRNLVTTLDMNIQQIVQNKIDEFDATYGDEEHHDRGAKNVGVVVMDPNSGEVLAMASNSEFDLNNPDNLKDEYTGAEIKAMSDQEYVEALNKRWSNFCVSESYEPGSVVKPITIASALQIGAVHDGEHFYCDGGEFITDTKINCDNIYGHGDETLEFAIVNSCNDALMQIAFKMHIDNFIEYEKLFGFGSTTGIDLPNETPGVTYSRENMHEVELATCAFGQGFTVSMVQEAVAFSAVINGGYYYQPHVLRQVQNSKGAVEKNVDPLVLKQPISSQVSSLVRQYITTAVQQGTGQKSQVPGYLTGGKTGTAEKIDPDTGRRAGGKYLVSFIGACPMDDPQVLIYVIVDEPNVAEQADSSYAQVLFRNIATEVFPYLNLYPTEEVTPELLAYLGLSEADVVKGGSRNVVRFQAYDSYGNLYNDCYVEDDVVYNSEGTPIEGAYIGEDGNVIDGYGNHIDIGGTDEETSDTLAAENPNIPTPPEEAEDQDNSDDTVWSGVTNDDLKDDAEEE